MRLKKHYKFHNIKFIRLCIILFILLVLLAINIFYTWGKYTNTVDGNANINIAKWMLFINGEQMSNNSNLLSSVTPLINSSDGSTNIDVGDECYFDIIINPTSTEVAVECTISMDLTDDNSTLPIGAKIKKYEKYNGDSEQLISTNDVNQTSTTIIDNINLVDMQTALASGDAIKYRIYCQMPNYADLTQNTELKVTPQITVRQIL